MVLEEVDVHEAQRAGEGVLGLLESRESLLVLDRRHRPREWRTSPTSVRRLSLLLLQLVQLLLHRLHNFK